MRREKMQNNDRDEKKRSSEIQSFAPVSEEDSARFPRYFKQRENTPPRKSQKCN